MKKILAIPGSIRKNSFNKSACKVLVDIVAQKSSPILEDVELKIFVLDDVPMFSQDLEADLPSEVQELISQVEWADAVIFSTPEYNNMVPGVLKNTCEWLSRSYAIPAVEGKPVAIMGASDGGFGTVRSQNQLLLLASIIKFQVDASLRLPISRAQDLFDEQGNLTSTDIRAKIQDLLERLAMKI